MRSIFAVTLLALAIGTFACSKKDSGGGTSAAQFTFKGKVSSTRTRTGTITDVMAVSAESASSARYMSAVAADGTFSIPVNTDRPYLLVFIDRTKVGAAMIIARVTAASLGLHTLPVSGTGTLDTGTMTTTGSTADITAITGNLLTAALGITAAAATSVAALDGVVLRYTNPDIDGDGIPDVLQNREYRLDFHVRYDMKVAGVSSTINDLFVDFLPTTVKEIYNSTGIYVSYQSSIITATTGTVKFLGDGTALSGDVVTQEAGAVATGSTISSLTVNGYGSFNGFGPNLTSTSHVPVGEYDYIAGSSTLKFTSVTPSSQATLANPNGDILPFVRFRKTDSTCTSACTIAGIDYKWMTYDGTTWSPVADLATLKMRVSDSGGFISIRRAGDSTKGIGATIPPTALTGSLAWTSTALNLQGVSDAELAATTSAMVCHFGLSYDDKLGMRHFENIAGNVGECGT